jgi:hypothetical protein
VPISKNFFSFVVVILQDGRLRVLIDCNNYRQTLNEAKKTTINNSDLSKQCCFAYIGYSKPLTNSREKEFDYYQSMLLKNGVINHQR